MKHQDTRKAATKQFYRTPVAQLITLETESLMIAISGIVSGPVGSNRRKIFTDEAFIDLEDDFDDTIDDAEDF